MGWCRSKRIEKSCGRDSKDQKVRVVKGLNVMAEYEKAQPDIIDKAEIITSTTSHGLRWIERPYEPCRLVNRRVDECRIAQIGRKFSTPRRQNFGIVGQAAIGEHRLDHGGHGIAVAPVVHLGDGRADAKEDPPPISN